MMFVERTSRWLLNLPYKEGDRAISELMHAYENGKGVFVFVDGGSAALASQFTCDLAGNGVRATGQKRFQVTGPFW